LIKKLFYFLICGIKIFLSVWPFYPKCLGPASNNHLLMCATKQYDQTEYVVVKGRCFIWEIPGFNPDELPATFSEISVVVSLTFLSQSLPENSRALHQLDHK